MASIAYRNAEMNVTVFGICNSTLSAECAVDGLLAAGFLRSDISVLLPARRTARAATNHRDHAKARFRMMRLLAETGTLEISGIAPLIVAGPVVDGLVDLGVPYAMARQYESHIQNEGALISVHCSADRKVSAAKHALKENGPAGIFVAYGAAGMPSPDLYREDRSDNRNLAA